MISILFSPSEGKRAGGSTHSPNPPDLLFGQAARQPILRAYAHIVQTGITQQALALFGLKKAKDAEAFMHPFESAPVIPAVRRYDGVAYNYLNFDTLDPDAQAYLFEHLIIFSNLYGPLRGGDPIANYKVKQGNRVGDIAPEQYYKSRFNAALDAHLEGTELLDLRAGYYDKFYKPSQPVTTMKFIKGGKVVSHWAKAYRGSVARHQAQRCFETVDALLASDIPGLQLKEIVRKRNGQEVVYDILT